MKKTFRFLALSFALICGTLSSFAGTRPATSVGPADGVYVGNSASISSGYVAYKVVGWDTDLDAYQVEITGLNNQGKNAKPTSLTILTSFEEDYGQTSYKYYVTKISDASASDHVAFWAQTSLTSLNFTNGGAIADDDFTINVGDYAFYGCSKLQTLVLPTNAEVIGAHCFEGTAVVNFEIPAGTKTIEENAFYDCQKLNTVTVAEGNDVLTEIPAGVFGNSTLKVLNLTNAEALTELGKTGSPFKFNTSDRNNQLTTVTLPETVTDINAAFIDCSALTAINGLENTAITAFDNNAFNGCSSLPILNFPVGAASTVMLKSDGTDGPFKGCAKLATITFPDAFVGTLGDGSNNIFCDNLAALTKITFKGAFYGTIAASAFGNSTAAKACSKLATVEFLGAIAADETMPVPAINASAFQNCAALATLTFNGFTTAEKAPAAITIASNAFSGIAITSLNLGDITLASKDNASSLTISSGAFGSAVLEGVTIGDVTLTENTGSKIEIATYAFGGVKIAKFTVGDISMDKSGQTVSFAAKTVSKVATAATTSESLATVTFGDIAGKGKVTVSGSAFESTKLATVTFGDIAGETEIQANAFKSTLATGTYAVTIGDISGKVTIAAAAFSPAAPASTYTLGDFDFATGTSITAGAFVGSTKSGAANSTVTVGAVNKDTGAWGTFTNIKDLTIESWNTNIGLARIGNPVTLTVGDITAPMASADETSNTITDITIEGNVTVANALNKFGKNVRNITFSADDPQVMTGAIASLAFKPAATQAIADDELITVIYRCETEGNYNQIFATDAFNDTDDQKVVVLYTTDWAAQRIFKDVTINRLEVSASEVAPGEDIKATMIAAKNGQYKYGKLYVPQGNGMYYKIKADKKADGKNTVNVFSAHLDGDDIYMKQIDVYNGYYWIDATAAEQVFVVRTSDLTATEVTAEAATAAEIADGDNFFWFDDNDALTNALNYANDAVPNQQLQNDTPFKNHTIYVMLNPATQNLAFGKLNQYATTANLPKNAVYVISNTDPQAAAGRLNVVFEDDDEATAINKVEAQKSNDGEIYNLQGVRVKSAQKGVYIINGKKVIR